MAVELEKINLESVMDDRNIYITEQDRWRLLDLSMDAQSSGYRGSVRLDQLRGELARDQIV